MAKHKENELIFEAYAKKVIKDTNKKAKMKKPLKEAFEKEDAEMMTEISMFIEVEHDPNESTSRAIEAFHDILNKYSRTGALRVQLGGTYLTKPGVSESSAYLRLGRNVFGSSSASDDIQEFGGVYGYLSANADAIVSDLYDALGASGGSDDINHPADESGEPGFETSFEANGEKVRISYEKSF
jgi:hypothetical protein